MMNQGRKEALSASRYANQKSLSQVEDHRRQILGNRLLQSLRLIQRGQHPNGEILSFRRDQDGNYRYHRSPFISSFIHEVMGCFDPGSYWWQDGSLGLIPDRARTWFLASVLDLRKRIRSYLSWQQESAGWWRFFGRGSGIDPDVNTTINASLAIREGFGGRHQQRRKQEHLAIQTFRADNGKYHSFYRAGYGGYGWMDQEGRPIPGFDRVVNADVYRYLRLGGLDRGRDVDSLVEYLITEINRPEPINGTPLYPNPLCFYYSLSRTWSDTEGFGSAELAESVLTKLLDLQTQDGGFGGPLSTAIGGLTLIQLGYSGTALKSTYQAVLRGLQADGGWGYEDFIIDGFGSPALTTALSMAFLARFVCHNGWIDP